jgi:hypothetical protein
MFDRRGTISRFGSDRPIMVGTRDGVVVGNEAIVTDDELCLVDVGSELPGARFGLLAEVAVAVGDPVGHRIRRLTGIGAAS